MHTRGIESDLSAKFELSALTTTLKHSAVCRQTLKQNIPLTAIQAQPVAALH
jgi:hypothetical protein